MNGRIVKVDLINPGKTGKQLVIATDESGEVHLLFETPVVVPNNSPVVKAKAKEKKKKGRPPSMANGGLLVCPKGHDLTIPGVRGVRETGKFFCTICQREAHEAWLDKKLDERAALRDGRPIE